MYFFVGFLLLFVLCGILFFHRRKKKICKKLCNMNAKEKCEKLTELITPFGYCYDLKQDVFSTTIDAWQRDFGYMEAYNHYAPHFNMVFDNEPVYFDYNDRTWMIEFWKGQYGINTGGEVGIYYSDGFVPPALRDITLFKCVKDKDMLPMTIHLFQDDCSIAMMQKKHWWLTVFDMGNYCEPRELSMNIGITFPNEEMMNAFVKALLEKGYRQNDLCICGLKVLFLYNSCSTCTLGCFRKLLYRFAQWKNLIFCKLYLWVTKPFCTSLDRLLCLYYYVPFAFRHMLTMKHYKKCRKKKKRH